jgi:hypothetical protein
VKVYIPALGAGATQTTDFPPCVGDGTVASVVFVPDATWTGQATNFRRFRLLNTSRGNQVVAQLDVTSGTKALGTAVPITVTTGDPPYVREGDVLRWSSEAVGTGQADHGGAVHVVVNRVGGGTF